MASVSMCLYYGTVHPTSWIFEYFIVPLIGGSSVLGDVGIENYDADFVMLERSAKRQMREDPRGDRRRGGRRRPWHAQCPRKRRLRSPRPASELPRPWAAMAIDD